MGTTTYLKLLQNQVQFIMCPDSDQNIELSTFKPAGLVEKAKPFEPGLRDGAPQLAPFHFKKGVSGNPKGRPKKNPDEPMTVRIDKRRLVRTLFEHGAEEVIKQTLEQAKQGDVKAQALVLQYIVPSHKSELSPVDLELAPNASLEDRLAALAAAATAGKISPDSAAAVSKSLRDLIESAKILEAHKKLDSLRKEVQAL